MKHSTALILPLIALSIFGLTKASNDFVFESPNSLKETNIKPRIIGGDEALPHSFPYQVGLHLKIYGQEERIFCGGSLLNEVFVLTAAHCIDSAYEAEVVLGAHKVFDSEPTQQRFISIKFIIHRGWNPFALSDDIGLVRLPRAANYTSAVQPILLPSLPDEDKSFTFKTATITGWGIITDGATTISPVLRRMESKVTLPLICKLFFFGKTGSNHICVDGYHGRSICSGDSGGPMVIPNEDGELVQQGIVSFGIGFGCEKKWPQVFTRLAKYRTWIYEHTGIGTYP